MRTCRMSLTAWALLLLSAWPPHPAFAALEGPLPLNIVRAPQAVTVDGQLDDWALTAPVTYEVDASAADRTVRTYAMWNDADLFLAYEVHDASPMKNAGNDPSSAFKSGDSLHVYFSTDAAPATLRAEGGPGDFHVLMTLQQGKPVVFAFRQRKAGADAPAVIRSPATSIELAWMGPVPAAELAVAPLRGAAGYVAEVRLPLEFFDGFRPEPGRKAAADVAVNFSDTSGTRNQAKVWWSRGASQILDIPTELRFERNLWGTAIFRAPGETPIVIDNGRFYVVPAPGAVTVDGDLADWDLSCAYGPHYVDAQLKDRCNVAWAAMYDSEALYLGAVFNAGGPLDNAGGINNVWWQGDSLEFRLIADVQNQGGDLRANDDILTFGVWHNAAENKDYVALQRSFKFAIGDTSALTVCSRPTAGGRIFELRVPWSVVRSGNYPKAGDSVAWTMAAIWKNGLRAYGMGSISSFRGIGDWGQARFLAQGRQSLVYLNLPRPAEAAAPVEEPKVRAALDVPRPGLLSAGVYDAGGRLVRTLFAGRTVSTGRLDVAWSGRLDDGQPAAPGRYQVRAVLNSGLRARYVTSACSPGKPPHNSENPKGGWGGVWGNVVDLAADARGVYPLWAMEEGDGALMQTDENGNLQWRQRIPLALAGRQTAVAVNDRYVFVTTDDPGPETGRAGLWRVSATSGVYAAFAHAGSDPLEFHLEGITRPIRPKAEETRAAQPPAASGLAADDRFLYVSAWHLDRVAVFDAESAKPVRTFAVEKPLGLCLDGKGGLLAVSGPRIVRIELASGTITPWIAADDGLDAPWDVAADRDGSILVTDRGASQQVKRFTRDGQAWRVKAFGQAGGRDNNGPFAPDRLNTPAGVAVAPSGKVFYSEDAEPRIFARLSAELAFESLWSGPWYLSGEVCVDPYKPEDLYLWSHRSFVRHTVDYAKKTSSPAAVWSDFALPPESYGRWFPRVVQHAGRKYLFCGGPTASLFALDGDRMWLAAAVGVDRTNNAWGARWVFSDANANGRLDDGEKAATEQDKAAPLFVPSYWGGSVDERDLTLWLLDGRGRAALALTPVFPKPGAPLYSFERCREVPLDAARKPGPNANLSSLWHAPDGGVFGNADANGSDPRGIGHSSHLSDVYVYRLDRDGNLRWRAGKKASGIAKNGEFYGRACGLGGPIGDEYFSFVDENGQDKVYTQDGLFVGNLLDDTATAAPSENTLLVEHFNSIVYRNVRDGKWYFVAGASGFASVWEIAGLDTISRLTAELSL